MGKFSTPFDEFERSSRNGVAVRAGSLYLWVQAGLRGLSVGALWVAVLTASFIIVRHVVPLTIGSQPPISFKSGVTLIAIGVSYFFLIAMISFIDDVVAFLFVVDLSIVIRHNLRNCAGERLVRKASFPVVKTIESFNFATKPSIDEGHVRTLLQGKYIERRENIVIVGKSGTGKTHLAGALGYAACFQRKRILFTTASALVTELVDSYRSHRLRHLHRCIDRLDLLIVDEMGYRPFSELGTQLLFEVLRAGYERVSLIITTTIPLEKWGEAFQNESGARSVADRLTDLGHLFEATGDPYWKPERKAIVSPQFRTF